MAFLFKGSIKVGRKGKNGKKKTISYSGVCGLNDFIKKRNGDLQVITSEGAVDVKPEQIQFIDKDEAKKSNLF